MSIFKACDIRGVYGCDLTSTLFLNLGVGLARMMGEYRTVCVGGDLRTSTPALMEGLIQGLLQSGKKVIDVGQAPTPAIYFAKRGLGAEACAIVTASHNPPEHNGLKFMIGDFPVREGDTLELERLSYPLMGNTPSMGERVRQEILPAYADFLVTTAEEMEIPPLTVVVDPGGGATTLSIPKILPRLRGPRSIPIHADPDPEFRCRPADSSREENLGRLREEVVRFQADLGAAFDGDGDRVSFVDDTGGFLSADETLVLLIRGLGETLKGQTVVLDQKLSRVVFEAVREGGGTALPEKSGHAFIKRTMIETGAVLGGEISGHYFYPELVGGDDGLFTLFRMMTSLKRLGGSLSELRKTIPPRHACPELRIPFDPSRAPELIERIAAAFSSENVSRLDGVRVETEEGWFLVRPSITEPAITVRIEGASPDALRGLTDRLGRVVPEVTDRLG